MDGPSSPAWLFTPHGTSSYYEEKCSKITSLNFLQQSQKYAISVLKNIWQLDKDKLVSDPHIGYENLRAGDIIQSYKAMESALCNRILEIEDAASSQQNIQKSNRQKKRDASATSNKKKDAQCPAFHPSQAPAELNSPALVEHSAARKTPVKPLDAVKPLVKPLDPVKPPVKPLDVVKTPVKPMDQVKPPGKPLDSDKQKPSANGSELECFQQAKKTCRIVSPVPPSVELHNKFQDLPECMDTGSTEPVAVNTDYKPPFIFLDTSTDPTKTLQDISVIDGQEISARIVGQNIKFRASSLQHHDTIVNMLKEKKLAFHTSTVKSRRPLKFIIKGIPHTTPVDDLTCWLKEKGFPVKCTTSLYKPKPGDRSPPFVITIPQGTESEELLKIKRIKFYPVKVEILRRNKNRILICYNCCQSAHSSHTCNRSPACGFCGSAHASRDCGEEAKKAKFCIRCNTSTHSAMDIVNCPALKKAEIPVSKVKKTRGPDTAAGLFQKKPEDFPDLPTTEARPQPTSGPSKPLFQHRSYAEVINKQSSSEPQPSSFKTNAIPAFLQAHSLMQALPSGQERLEAMLNAYAALFAVLA